jgi:hypothetical protein
MLVLHLSRPFTRLDCPAFSVTVSLIQTGTEKSGPINSTMQALEILAEKAGSLRFMMRSRCTTSDFLVSTTEAALECNIAEESLQT